MCANHTTASARLSDRPAVTPQAARSRMRQAFRACHPIKPTPSPNPCSGEIPNSTSTATEHAAHSAGGFLNFWFRLTIASTQKAMPATRNGV